MTEIAFHFNAPDKLAYACRLLRKANSHTTAGFNEGIVSVRTSKSFVREERNLAEFGEHGGEILMAGGRPGPPAAGN